MEVGDPMTGEPGLSALEANGKEWRAGVGAPVQKVWSNYQRVMKCINEQAAEEGLAPSQVARNMDVVRGTVPVATFFANLLKEKVQRDKAAKANAASFFS